MQPLEFNCRTLYPHSPKPRRFSTASVQRSRGTDENVWPLHSRSVLGEESARATAVFVCYETGMGRRKSFHSGNG